MDNKKILFTKKVVNIEKTPIKKKSIENYVKKNTENEELVLNNYKNDIDCIRKIYMNVDFSHKKFYIKNIQDKINSYLHQDKIKERNLDSIITFDETTEKILESKLKCYYCKCKMLICYQEKREGKQWTLDRIDNSIGHFTDNVVCSCLDCNLKKRTRDSEKFRFSKQMKIKKIY